MQDKEGYLKRRCTVKTTSHESRDGAMDRMDQIRNGGMDGMEP